MALILIAALAQSPGPSYTEYKDRYCSSIDCEDAPCSGGYHFGNEPVADCIALCAKTSCLCMDSKPATRHPEAKSCRLTNESAKTQLSGWGFDAWTSGRPPPPPAPTPPPSPPLPPDHPDAASACASFNFSQLVEIMHGFGEIDGYSRNSGCGYECGRKTFRWDNGPQGFGDGSPAGKSTQWPSTLNMAASFDPALADEWGTAMGEEFWNKGTNIQEGPGINIARIERNGRTFEYVSGEDPVLGGRLARPLVDGIQKSVMAITKHYILNNQETDRSGVDEHVDEKTIMELYAPPFGAAAATSAGYMCSYNRINGLWACEDPLTLTTILKGYYNFSGFVVSDWGACHGTSDFINGGLDIEMPNGKNFNEAKIQAALDAKEITMGQLHDSCVRVLRGWYSLPVDKRYPCGGANCIQNNVSTPAHKDLARKIAAQSTVLVKNTGNLLPLDKTKKLKIALIGDDAARPYVSGQGSGGVGTSDRLVSPLAAFQARGADVNFTDHSDVDAMVAAAKAADVAIVFGSAHSGEGHDRKDLNLEDGMDAAIAAVAAAQKNTVVAVAVPGQILTDWRDSVPAILVAFLPGEQYGNAIADLIYGDAIPQAKLPLTFPKVNNEQKMTLEQWPGIPSKQFPGNLQVTYSEGQIVGYRWYDKNLVKPAFPFGHGLTYGGMKYSGLAVTGRTVSFKLAGTGCDTAQVYIGYPTASSDPAVPVKVMRHFVKSCNATTSVSYTFTDRDVSNWDLDTKQWTVTKGEYELFVGSSSQDIRLQGTMTV